MITAYAKNEALDGLAFTHVSAHSDWPGATGANELSGGSYERVSVTVAAASGGIRTGAQVSLSVPASTIKWLGWWDGSNFLFATPNGGSTPRNFIAMASTDIVYSPAHGYSDTTEIVFWGGTAPGGTSAGTIYFVRDATTDTFKVAATSGGTAIDLTASASAGCWVSAITTKTYAGAGTHTITISTFLVPD